MPLVINTNISSLNAQRLLSNNSSMLAKSMERLASGYRINHAGDDAAGLMISEGLRTQIRGSQKALANVQDGINVLNIADGAMQVVEDNVQRIRELVVQAANDTNSTTQRTAVNNEINALRADIDRLTNATQANGVILIGSSVTLTSFRLQVGPNSTQAIDTIDIFSALGDTSTDAAGLNLAAANITDNASALAYLTTVDTSISALNVKRASLGAISNRLESSAQYLSISIENQSASESRIRNADVAQESANLSRNQVLQQSAAMILTQANQLPQLALQLLKGG